MILTGEYGQKNKVSFIFHFFVCFLFQKEFSLFVQRSYFTVLTWVEILTFSILYFIIHNRADLLYLERGVAPQKRYYDEDYGDVITAPAKRNEAINRIISRLRPTYSKRPRERYDVITVIDRYKVCIYVFPNFYDYTILWKKLHWYKYLYEEAFRNIISIFYLAFAQWKQTNICFMK